MIEDSENSKILNLLNDIKPGKWTQKKLTDGNTNKIILSRNDEKKVIIRIFGQKTEKLINREAEQENLKLLISYGLAPKLEAKWKNGYILGFVDGRALNEGELPKYYKPIAKKMRKFHSIDVYGTPMLFKTLTSWYWAAAVNHKEILNEKNILNLINLGKERAKNCKIAFCHNDLLAGNIIATYEQFTESDTENQIFASNQTLSENVEFIDFEYSGINYVAFDIANHFREHIGYTRDARNLPDDNFMLKFIREYYKNVSDVNEAIVLSFLAEVKFFFPLSNCFWGLWGLLKSDINNTGFDYLEYGLYNLCQIPDDLTNWFPKRV